MEKRLNNKGYMLVEIIIAFALAMVVGYFLTELTIKLKNKNDDLLVKTLVSTDQAIIYNTIVEDLYRDPHNFSCDYIKIENNKFKYQSTAPAGVNFTNLVSEYAEVDAMTCKKTDYEITIKIPINVKQLPDENFDVDIRFRLNPFYAVYFSDGSLRFYNASHEPIVEGDTVGGAEAIKVFTSYGKENYTCKIVGDYNDENNYYVSSTAPWHTLYKEKDLSENYNKYKSKITTIVFEDEIIPETNTNCWFADFRNVTFVNLQKLNTSNVKSMAGMFHSLGKSVEDKVEIIGLDGTNFNVSNVKSMTHMFDKTGFKARDVEIGSLKDWDTSKVNDMAAMFQLFASSSAIELDLSGWDTSQVTKMNHMFYYQVPEHKILEDGTKEPVTMCNTTEGDSWSVGDLRNWDTSNVTTMQSMFFRAGYCDYEKFNIGNIGTWDVSNVTNMFGMFELAGNNASKTVYIGDLSSWDTSNVTNMFEMFDGLGQNVTDELDLGNLSCWNVSNVKTMAGMFGRLGSKAKSFNISNANSNCDKDNLSGWKISSEVTDMSEMFHMTGERSTNWELDLSGWDVSNVIDCSVFNAVSASVAESKVTPPNFIEGCNLQKE